MRSARMTPGIIKSAERMTYTNVNKVLEGDAEANAMYAPLAHHFRDMKELALLLNARRNEHGSIDFDLPERVIEFDEQQKMINITRSERNIAHRLIEEFMLAANRAVAIYLLNRGIEALHRVHEKPDAKKVFEFEELARAFGYSLGVEGLEQREIAVRHGRVASPARAGRPDSLGKGRERGMRVALPGSQEGLRITPQHYQRLVRKLAGKPEERIISYLMLRSLKQARYSDQNVGHFALAASSYTHFTSPIRRYPDLIVHRVLKAHLDGKTYEAPLRDVAESCSETERRAADAERELVEWKKVKFMMNRVGDDFNSLIISTTRFGFFVELEDLFIEGLVPIDTLPNDRFAYHENTRKIIGERTRRQFSIGDKVRVRLDRVDAVENKLQFSLAEPEHPRRQGGRPSVRARL